jgi:hypothetical protein
MVAGDGAVDVAVARLVVVVADEQARMPGTPMPPATGESGSTSSSGACLTSTVTSRATVSSSSPSSLVM